MLQRGVFVQDERVVIITDLHGCLDECKQLLDKLDFDKTRDRLINLGDTIDRGPQIYELFVFLRELKEEMGDRCVLLRGNHEQMMLDATGGSSRDKELWYLNSGEKTVFSFINHKHKIKEFRDWYEQMPYYYIDERFQCVHACLQDEDPAENDVMTLIWGRDTGIAQNGDDRDGHRMRVWKPSHRTGDRGDPLQSGISPVLCNA